MNWISIKKELPSYYTGVIITDGSTITCGALCKHGWGPWGWNGHEWEFDFDDSEVIYWMPLPDLPERETK